MAMSDNGINDLKKQLLNCALKWQKREKWSVIIKINNHNKFDLI